MRSLVFQPVHGHDAGYEYAVLRSLSSGSLQKASELIASGDPSVAFVRLAQADLRLRSSAISVPELQALHDEMAAEARDSSLRCWAEALLCERLLLQSDPMAFAIAEAGLSGIDAEALPPLVTLYARARLRRVSAMAWFIFPAPEAHAAHRRRRDGALHDLYRCGFTDEFAVTRGLFAGVHAVLNEEDIVEAYGVLTHTLAVIDASDGSDDNQLGAAIAYFLALVAYEVGEYEVALRASAQAGRASATTPAVDMLQRYLRAATDILNGVPDAVEAADSLLSDHVEIAPYDVASAYIHLAHLLADLGHPDASRFARRTAEQALLPAWYGEEDLLAVRADLVDGISHTADQVIALLERIRSTGRARHAARLAVRLAGDLGHVGQIEDGRRLLDWAMPLVPTSGRATANELVWLERAHLALSAAAESPAGHEDPAASHHRVEIRLLTPTLEVSFGGRPATLSDTPARLVVALALAYPAPLHQEAVGDLLWPGEPIEAYRGRLNTLVHRLRRSIGEDAVIRRNELLSLDARRCTVDLSTFRQALVSDIGAQRAAVAGVRGAVCHVQFPYDEAFADHRHRFVAMWLMHARRLVAAGVPPSELADALEALGLCEHDVRV